MSNIDIFLKKHGMHPDAIDIGECTKTFVEEMRRGLDGRKSTLMMLPAYLSPERAVPDNEPVIVMDAGGTNFRTALVTFADGRPNVEYSRVQPMPGSYGEISKEEFLQTIAGYLEPVIGKSDKIGFCFSYPAEILPNRDGRLIGLSKEVRVRGSDNMHICAEIAKKLAENGVTGTKRFVLLNDTAAALLGGICAMAERPFETYVGFVYGTGINTCYIEQTAGIGKLGQGQDMGKMLVNTESGGYGKMPSGEFDRLFDQKTVNPGSQLLEKMVSGRYQGGVILLTLQQAAAQGLFSAFFANATADMAELSMKEVDEFCYHPYGNNTLAGICADDGDVEALYAIIDRSVDRAAKMITSSLAAILLKTDSGRMPHKPVCIVAEGSSFYKAKLFRDRLNYYMRDHIVNNLSRYYEFVKVDDANLLGAAAAALSNC